jgi:hypothetical protein
MYVKKEHMMFLSLGFCSWSSFYDFGFRVWATLMVDVAYTQKPKLCTNYIFTPFDGITRLHTQQNTDIRRKVYIYMFLGTCLSKCQLSRRVPAYQRNQLHTLFLPEFGIEARRMKRLCSVDVHKMFVSIFLARNFFSCRTLTLLSN